MITAQQLARDLENLQNGDCWLGYNALQVIEGIDVKTAGTKAYEAGNSIWQIINHISYWREIITMRIQAKSIVKAKAEGFDEPFIKNEESWKETMDRFQNSYNGLRAAIASISNEDLYAPLQNSETLYYNISGCIQHDAFHLGQIMILKRMAGVSQ